MDQLDQQDTTNWPGSLDQHQDDWETWIEEYMNNLEEEQGTTNNDQHENIIKKTSQDQDTNTPDTADQHEGDQQNIPDNADHDQEAQFNLDDSWEELASQEMDRLDLNRSLIHNTPSILTMEDDLGQREDDFLSKEDDPEKPRFLTEHPPSTQEDQNEDNPKAQLINPPSPPLLEHVRKTSQEDYPDQLDASTSHDKAGLAIEQILPTTTLLTGELEDNQNTHENNFAVKCRADPRESAVRYHDGAGGLVHEGQVIRQNDVKKTLKFPPKHPRKKATPETSVGSNNKTSTDKLTFSVITDFLTVAPRAPKAGSLNVKHQQPAHTDVTQPEPASFTRNLGAIPKKTGAKKSELTHQPTPTQDGHPASRQPSTTNEVPEPTTPAPSTRNLGAIPKKTGARKPKKPEITPSPTHTQDGHHVSRQPPTTNEVPEPTTPAAFTRNLGIPPHPHQKDCQNSKCSGCSCTPPPRKITPHPQL